MEQSHLCNSERGHYGEHLCEYILSSGDDDQRFILFLALVAFC